MEQAPGIYARESPYLDRHVQIGYAQGKVLRVTFPVQADDGAESDHHLLDRVFAYLEGDRPDFDDVDVALTQPTDQRSVLETVREIPYGDDVDVATVTRMTPGLDPDEADDHETVRVALAANPAPLVVPDHRVRDGPSGAPPEVEQKLRTLENL